MTGNPQTVLNPATFPVDPKTCQPIWPHSYLKVNTIYEVAHNAGLRTAWSDKHPVYESFNGPSGTGIDDLFTPEIDSNAIEPDGTPYPGAVSWTGDNAATRQYDSYKVLAILNEIDGYDHSGTGPKVGVPAIFGMNFQTVSTAEKLFQSEAVIGGPVLPGGYIPGTTTPGPLLSSALDYINAQLQMMDREIQAQGIADQTAIIITAKHGQSPQDPNQLTRIKDGPIIDAINAAWTAAHPGAGNLIVAGTDDDCGRATCLTPRSKPLTSSRTTCGPTPRPASPTAATRGRWPTPAWRRSTRAQRQPTSSAFRPRIRATPTCSDASRSASSTPAAARSPSTEATTPAIVTCRSWSTHRAPCRDRGSTRGSRRPRLRRRSCACSGSTRSRCRPSRSRARAYCRAFTESPEAPRLGGVILR
jgi:hypothetical protein